MLIDADWCSFIGAYLRSFPGQSLSGPSHAPWAFLSQEWAYICLIWFQESFSWMLKESSCFGAHDHRWHSTLYSWGVLVFCQKGGQWRQVGMFPVNWNTLFSWADKSRIIYICSQSNIIQYYYGQISFFFSTLLKTKPTKQNILIYWAIFGPRLTKGALLRKPIPQKKLERYCKNCECCHS